jgi:hypothetical protein
MNKISLIILSFTLVCCSKAEKDEKLDELETVKDYYDTGELWSTTKMLNGKQHGQAVFYYKDGDTLEIQNWKNGLKQGKTTKFHPNGQVKYVANIKSDSILTKAYTYRPDGSLEVLHRFDEKGRLTHQYLYDSTGNLIDESPWLILRPEKDTILLGHENIFEVILLNYDTTALIDFALGTTADESSGIKDSFQISNKEENRGVVSIRPKQTGEYKIAGVLTEEDTIKRGDGKTDTISTKKVFQFNWEFTVK